MSADELRQAAETLRRQRDMVVLHPDTSAALAKWLDDVAAGWAWDLGDVYDLDGDLLTFEGSMDTHPLTIARLVNGGAA